MNLSSKRDIDAAVWHGRLGTQDVRWDDHLSGFGLRIYPTGKKSFILSYTVKGLRRSTTLGRYGALTPHQARQKAIATLAAIGRGEDPAGEKQGYRLAPTVTDLAARYLKEHAATKKKASSAAADARMWKLHILPALGRAKITEVTRADVASLHGSLADKPYVANRVLALLSKAFNLAEVWGWRPDGSNPGRHIERYREEKKERYLSEAELGRLGEALNEALHAQLAPASAIAAIRLLILTGCRVSEIRDLTWPEVDFERQCLRLKDSKTGRKTVYLNESAIGIFETLAATRDGGCVIASDRTDAHLVGLTRIWYRIRQRAGLEDVRLHDLRHTHAAFGASLGLSLLMIGKLLGHTQPITTQRYAHLAADPMREATARIGAVIAAALSPEAKSESLERRSAEGLQ